VLTEQATELLATFQRTLRTWDRTISGDRIAFRRTNNGPYRPPRHAPSWQQLLEVLNAACTHHGIVRNLPLPLRGLDDADLTFSAVQALDPYVKRQQPRTYRSGFLAQPVVRFTGDRDEHGALREGFLTSFVNVSIVQPIATVDEHVALINTWLSFLSRLGFHMRHIEITGKLTTWRRYEVAGITLRFRHGELTLGDAVLLWNANDPTFLATDIGSGLERLRWALTRRPWPETVYGALAQGANTGSLDALRTATLIAGSGIRPGPRGPGSAVRRLLRGTESRMGVFGLSRIVRWAHEYWSLTQPLPVPWPEVCRILEAEVFGDH
jgi:hypothetical protein